MLDPLNNLFAGMISGQFFFFIFLCITRNLENVTRYMRTNLS